VTPVLKYTKNDKLIETTKEKYNELVGLVNKFSSEFDHELLL